MAEKLQELRGPRIAGMKEVVEALPTESDDFDCDDSF